MTNMNLSKTYQVLVQPLFPLFSIFVLFMGCDNRSSTADLVLINGNVVTVDDSVPNAQAIAIRKDRIIAVGSMHGISIYIILCHLEAPSIEDASYKAGSIPDGRARHRIAHTEDGTLWPGGRSR